MSSIGELLSRLTVDKQRADELEADIERTNAEADELIEQMTALGFHSQAAQISEAKSRASQAQNARWAAEGHLEGAISVLQAVLDGQKGIGTKIPGGVADQGGTGQETGATKPDHGPLLKADDKSFVTEWNGAPVKITYAPPEPEHEPGPSGQKLLEQAEEESATLGPTRKALRGGIRKVDDIQGQAKEWASPAVNSIDQFTASTPETSTGTLQEANPPECMYPSQVFQQQPAPAVDPVQALTWGITMGLGVAEAASRARRQRRDDAG